MDTEGIIFNLEKRYLTQLESFFLREWGETRLWSHDLSHHRRVWKFAKELIPYFEIKNTDPKFLIKLMIACYLHDIGMATDASTKHGIYSREKCSQFLNENELKESDFNDVLHAVENHDDKEYTDPSGNSILLTILSVADDLDAFGYVGICRYLEIYLLRGTTPAEIGHKILFNARSRFSNFTNLVSVKNDFVDNNRKRFKILEQFFINYIEANHGDNSDIEISNTNVIVRTLSENITNTTTFYDFLRQDYKMETNPVFDDFLKSLRSELS